LFLRLRAAALRHLPPPHSYPADALPATFVAGCLATVEEAEPRNESTEGAEPRMRVRARVFSFGSARLSCQPFSSREDGAENIST
jgi:hypothetical protein